MPPPVRSARTPTGPANTLLATVALCAASPSAWRTSASAPLLAMAVTPTSRGAGVGARSTAEALRSIATVPAPPLWITSTLRNRTAPLVATPAVPEESTRTWSSVAGASGVCTPAARTAGADALPARSIPIPRISLPGPTRSVGSALAASERIVGAGWPCTPETVTRGGMVSCPGSALGEASMSARS